MIVLQLLVLTLILAGIVATAATISALYIVVMTRLIAWLTGRRIR